jgi:hypothetical protein
LFGCLVVWVFVRLFLIKGVVWFVYVGWFVLCCCVVVVVVVVVWWCASVGVRVWVCCFFGFVFDLRGFSIRWRAPTSL